MRVRAALPADGPAIGEVHVGAWRAAYAGLMPQSFLDSLDPKASGSTWAARLRQAGAPGTSSHGGETATVLVLENHAGRMVGISSVGAPQEHPDELGDDVGELWMINLLPEAWGSGGGALLLEAAIDALRERGYRTAVLWVLDSNLRARRFYEKHGWVADGTAKVDDARGFPLHEVRYRRSLV